MGPKDKSGFQIIGGISSHLKVTRNANLCSFHTAALKDENVKKGTTLENFQLTESAF